MPEVEEERTPEDVRPVSLVDPLPFLKSGRWSGVDVEHFLPTQEKTVVNPQLGLMGARGQSRRTNMAPEDESPVMMVRTLDFTVESGRTYRYRSRVVLWNPDFERAGRRQKWIFGPWSEATEIVTVP